MWSAAFYAILTNTCTVNLELFILCFYKLVSLTKSQKEYKMFFKSNGSDAG